MLFSVTQVECFREKKSLNPRVLLSHSSCVKDMKSIPNFKRIYQLWFSLSLFPLFPFPISLFPILFQSCKLRRPFLWNVALELAWGPISPSCYETASQNSKISTRIYELNKLIWGRLSVEMAFIIETTEVSRLITSRSIFLFPASCSRPTRSRSIRFLSFSIFNAWGCVHQIRHEVRLVSPSSLILEPFSWRHGGANMWRRVGRCAHDVNYW